MLNIHQKSTGVFRLNIGSGYDHDHDMWDAQKEDWVKVKSEIEKKVVIFITHNAEAMCSADLE